jgi:hypothetical protein
MAPINLARAFWNVPGVQCTSQLVQVLGPWAAVAGGTITLIFSDGTGVEVAIPVTLWGVSGIQKQAQFANGGPTFDKC